MKFVHPMAAPLCWDVPNVIVVGLIWKQTKRIFIKFDIRNAASEWVWPVAVNLVGRRLSHVVTHWGRMKHIYVCNLQYVIIGSDNGLSPVQHQAPIWVNAGLLPSAKWRPFWPGLNVVN